ncbi:MAG: hypothetical protein WA435_12010 [Gallionellaceae bacterium]
MFTVSVPLDNVAPPLALDKPNVTATELDRLLLIVGSVTDLGAVSPSAKLTVVGETEPYSFGCAVVPVPTTTDTCAETAPVEPPVRVTLKLAVAPSVTDTDVGENCSVPGPVLGPVPLPQLIVKFPVESELKSVYEHPLVPLSVTVEAMAGALTSPTQSATIFSDCIKFDNISTSLFRIFNDSGQECRKSIV